MKGKLRQSGFGRLLLILTLAWLASACQSDTPDEACEVAGDEDDNGLADCRDPACASAPVCQPRCGNGKLEAGEGCDDGNGTSGDGCDNNCTPTTCGNGVMTMNEGCDDGNPINGDGCDNNCMATGCGNGIVTRPEECDDRNGTSGDGCDNNCTFTVCGNGVITEGEICDDGNVADGDGCDHDCTSGCGNGIVGEGEECDDANRTSGDGCDANCTITECGNGIITEGETCDDGNVTDGDGCDHDCTSGCGNGIVSEGEECDDANLINGDGCDSNCTVTECGNGIVTAGEECDDGNVADGDGCDSTCTAELTYVKASNTGAGDLLGESVALSADGSTLAVGVRGDDSAVTGIGSEQTDDSAANAGAVYVFARNGTTWIQQAYIKASNTNAGDLFGVSVALSADGSTLAVGAVGEDSAARGIGGEQADNAASGAGAVYVFARNGTTWIQQAYIKASNTDAEDRFGVSVALSADGFTLAVGADLEDSAARGIGGEQTDNSAQDNGAVYVFVRSGTTWSQQAYVKASNNITNPLVAFSFFGFSVALSPDSSTLAVGAPGRRAAYVFTRSGTTWRQEVYADWFGVGNSFGFRVVLSADGSILAVSDPWEASAATGNSAQEGAVYVLARNSISMLWSEQARIKASNIGTNDQFGLGLALAADGSTLVVGADLEDSAAIGIDGDQTDNSAPSAGAVYAFTRSGTTWSQQAYIKASNTGAFDRFGGSVALAADASTLAVGAPGEASAATGINGDHADNSAPFAGAVYVYQ